MNVVRKEVNIYPSKVRIYGKLYSVEPRSEEVKIKKITLYLDRANRLTKVVVDTKVHPNCDPRTKEFCLPEEVKKLEYNETLVKLVGSLLSVWNLDNCFAKLHFLNYFNLCEEEVVGKWHSEKNLKPK
jgi:hypothetical protein